MKYFTMKVTLLICMTLKMNLKVTNKTYMNNSKIKKFWKKFKKSFHFYRIRVIEYTLLNLY